MNTIDFKSTVKVLKANCHYRFSDLFFKKGIRWEQDRATILNSSQFEGTILRSYLEQMKCEQDFDTLSTIIKHYPLTQTPSDSELVIHLRCGDVFSRQDTTCRVMHDEQLLRATKCFESHSPIHSDDITQVTIVTAMHFGANTINNRYFYDDETYIKNIEFLNAFQRHVNLTGKSLRVVSHTDPDTDICYMAHAKHFIKSPSSLSEIITTVAPVDQTVYF